MLQVTRGNALQVPPSRTLQRQRTGLGHVTDIFLLNRVRIEFCMGGETVVKMIEEKKIKVKGVSRFRALHSAKCGQSPHKDIRSKRGFQPENIHPQKVDR